MKKVRGFIILSQLNLGFFMLVCFIIEPVYFLRDDQGGISHYGTQLVTLVPYSFSFMGAGIFLWLAARRLRAKELRLGQLGLFCKILSVEYILVAFSTYPYQVNEFYRLTHHYISLTLVVTGALIGLYWGLKVLRSVPNVIYSLLLIAGLIISGLSYYFAEINNLYTGEILFGLGFALVFVHSARTIIASRRSEYNV
ncbi:hypothetical protein KY385_01720 [Candidatus Parcubacteria bacterium]|nr:hypothetical protein [Candidatus Parcubacteria bacterium]